MSIEAMNWAFKLKLESPSQKVVLLVLADKANSDNECWPGIDLIARESNCSKRTVIRVLGQLSDLGVLSSAKTYLNWKGRTTNRYTLHLDLIDIYPQFAPKSPESQLSDKLALSVQPVDNSPVDNSDLSDTVSLSIGDTVSLIYIGLTQRINHHLPGSENLVKKLTTNHLNHLGKVLPKNDDDQEIIINSETTKFLKQVDLSKNQFLAILPKYEIDTRQIEFKEFHTAVKPALDRILDKRSSIGYLPVYLAKAIKAQLAVTPMKPVEMLIGGQFFDCSQKLHKVMSLDGYCVICTEKSSSLEADLAYFQLSNRIQNQAVRS